MTEWAVSTNLISFAVAASDQPRFGWPMEGNEAQVVHTMEPGDLIVTKFAQSPSFSAEDQKEYQRGVCEVLGFDYEQMIKRYEDTIQGGQHAVPQIWRVKSRLPDDDSFPSAAPWAMVEIEVEDLPHPFSTQEFLRLRVIDTKLARQFKAMAAPGRRLQEIEAGTAAAMREAGQNADRGDALRRLSVVWAATKEQAAARLGEAGRTPVFRDQIFIAHDERMLGVYEVDQAGELQSVSGEEIKLAPASLLALMQSAEAKRIKKDYFKPKTSIAAAEQLLELMQAEDPVLVIDDFATFHDRYAILSRKVNEAKPIANREAPAPQVAGETEEEDEGEDTQVEADELARLQGLDIAAVRTALGPEIELPDAVLAEAVTALRSGKHLLLSGPPGTGKSTLATALCRAVMDDQFDIVTATADWTTFDTIGGYLPQENMTLRFAPGVVPRCLKAGRWLVIDELNRADIDKAFGPLFSLLAGTGTHSPVDSITLPFERDGKPIAIDWAERRTTGAADYTITPSWRLLGTLNVCDKASLFQLSFAFLRRFAVIDVPLPPKDSYQTWFEARCGQIAAGARGRVVEASMALAFGPRELGPAILQDVARFVTVAMTETSSGAASFPDADEAYLAAVRLFVAPQYEGSSSTDVAKVLELLNVVFPSPPERPWQALQTTLAEVALA